MTEQAVKLPSGHLFREGSVNAITPMDDEGSFEVIGRGFWVKVSPLEQWKKDPICLLRLLSDEGFIDLNPEEVSTVTKIITRIQTQDAGHLLHPGSLSQTENLLLNQYGELLKNAKEQYLKRFHAEAALTLMGVQPQEGERHGER